MSIHHPDSASAEPLPYKQEAVGSSPTAPTITPSEISEAAPSTPDDTLPSKHLDPVSEYLLSQTLECAAWRN